MCFHPRCDDSDESHILFPEQLESQVAEENSCHPEKKKKIYCLLETPLELKDFFCAALPPSCAASSHVHSHDGPSDQDSPDSRGQCLTLTESPHSSTNLFCPQTGAVGCRQAPHPVLQERESKPRAVLCLASSQASRKGETSALVPKRAFFVRSPHLLKSTPLTSVYLRPLLFAIIEMIFPKQIQ